jgi:hypothetical protein
MLRAFLKEFYCNAVLHGNGCAYQAARPFFKVELKSMSVFSLAEFAAKLVASDHILKPQSTR